MNVNRDLNECFSLNMSIKHFGLTIRELLDSEEFAIVI